MPSNDANDVKVSALMSDEIITCAADMQLASVAAILARRRVHAVFVIDGAGQLTGVVSDFDLLGGEWMADDEDSLRTMQRMTAGELMTAPIETISVDNSAAEAAERMRALRVSRLLVTSAQGTPVGVISVSDLIAPQGRPSGKRRTVRDVMSHAVVTCLPETSLHAAARAMTERRSRSVVIVSESGHVAGVITGNDLLLLYLAAEREHKNVAELMSTPVITCEPELALPDAVGLMIRHEVHRLVVTDTTGAGRIPTGIVSTADIVAGMANEHSDWQRTPA